MDAADQTASLSFSRRAFLGLSALALGAMAPMVLDGPELAVADDVSSLRISSPATLAYLEAGGFDADLIMRKRLEHAYLQYGDTREWHVLGDDKLEKWGVVCTDAVMGGKNDHSPNAAYPLDAAGVAAYARASGRNDMGDLDIATLRALLWFTWPSPGFDESVWPSDWQTQDSILDDTDVHADMRTRFIWWTHMIITVLKHGEQFLRTNPNFRLWDILDRSRGKIDWYRRAIWGDGPDSALTKIRARMDEVPDSFEVYIVDPGNAALQTWLAWKVEPIEGLMRLHKVPA